MKLDSNHENAAFIVVYDTDYDCKIENVIRADDEKNEYTCYDHDPKTGEFIRDKDGLVIQKTATANIRFLDRRLPKNKDILDRIGEKTIIPNCKVLGNNIVEMFGIQFKQYSGPSEEFYTIDDIAARNDLKKQSIEACLIKYGIMTKTLEWSEYEHEVGGVEEWNGKCVAISGFVIRNIMTEPDKYESHIHEEFILELMEKP
jgi:hypothetical protein